MNTAQLFDRRQIFANMGALLSGTAIARVLSALALILLARQVGPTAFGQFAASLALTKVSSVLFTLGLEGWMLRNGNRSGDKRILARLGASTLAITFSLGLIWLLTVALLAGFLNQAVFPYSVVILSALFVWLEGMIGTVWTTFKAGLQNKTTFVLITSTQVLLLLITILLMATGVKTLEIFLWGRVGAYLIACISAVLWLRHSMGVSLAPAEFPAILRGAIPFAISMALALIYERVDVTIVANWIGSTQAGFYAPAATLVSAMFLIPAAVFGVMLPVLSRIHAERSPQLYALIRQLLVASAGLGVALYLGVRVSAPYIINLIYGSAYAESTQVLSILALVLGLRSVTFALAAIIVAVGWQKWRLVPQGIAAAISVIVNVLIVSQFGIVGVAKVYVLSETVLMFGYLLLVILWRSRQNSPQLAG